MGVSGRGGLWLGVPLVGLTLSPTTQVSCAWSSFQSARLDTQDFVWKLGEA